MREYQNADYRSIYTSDPIDVPTVGECWLIIFIEEIECEDAKVAPNRDEWWTALFLVSPIVAGPEQIQDGLDLIGFSGQPDPTDQAVALAEAGNRIILWDRQSDDWEPDLEETQREAEKFMAEPTLLLPFLNRIVFGKKGYDSLR